MTAERKNGKAQPKRVVADRASDRAPLRFLIEPGEVQFVRPPALPGKKPVNDPESGSEVSECDEEMSRENERATTKYLVEGVENVYL